MHLPDYIGNVRVIGLGCGSGLRSGSWLGCINRASPDIHQERAENEELVRLLTPDVREGIKVYRYRRNLAHNTSARVCAPEELIPYTFYTFSFTKDHDLQPDPLL